MNIELLNRWGEQFLNFVWPMLWQSSLLIAVIFILDLALRRKVRAAVRHALWLVVLVKLMLPPSLALPTSPSWWIHSSAPMPVNAPPVSFTVTYVEQTMPEFPLIPAPIVPLKPPALKLAAWLPILSGVVSIGLLAWLLIRWQLINRKVRRAHNAGPLQPILGEAQRLARSTPAIRLKLTEDTMSPAVCGLFRPVILLPRPLVKKLSAEQLRAILLHEAIHLRRGDVWVNCAQALQQIVYWWHPLLWLANARIRRVREEAVDDAVMLALRDDAEIYAPTLLEVAKFAFRRPLASLGLVGILESRSALRQRIERLMDFNAPKKAGLTVVSILGILAFSAVALPMGQAPEKTNASNASALNLTIGTNTPVIIHKPSTNSVSGILEDTNFRAKLHALEQRAGVDKLAEPEPVTPAGRGANRINQIAVPDKINTSTLTTNAAESAELVQDGKMLYEKGEFDAAEAKLTAALALNPSNQAARYYLALVEESRRAPKLQGPRMFYPDPYLHDSSTNSDAPPAHIQTNAFHSNTGREAIFHKLNSIRLESVTWSNGTALSEAIRFLAEQSRLRDPDKVGVNFIFNPKAGVSNNVTMLDASTINVTLIRKNVSLLDLLDAMMQAADHPIKYSVEDYAVVISSKVPTPPQLETRVFRIDTNTFIAGVRDKIAGNPDFVFSPGWQTNSVSLMVKRFFAAVGVDLTAPGRALDFNGGKGLLFVRATPSEMDAVERVIGTLNMTPPQIHIKARFIEVPKSSLVPQISSLMPQLFTNTVAGQMTGILTNPEFRTVLYALEHQEGVVTLAEPECVTTSGRQTQMRSTDFMSVVTNSTIQVTSSNATLVPHRAKFEIGPSVDLVPYVLADGHTINLTALPELLEFLGYVKASDMGLATNQFDAKIPQPTVLPHFRARKAHATVNLWDNQTLVLGNLNSAIVGGNGQSDTESNSLREAEKINGTADKELLVFITATIVDPAGNRVHSDNNLPFDPSTIPPQPKISRAVSGKL